MTNGPVQPEQTLENEVLINEQQTVIADRFHSIALVAIGHLVEAKDSFVESLPRMRPIVRKLAGGVAVLGTSLGFANVASGSTETESGVHVQPQNMFLKTGIRPFSTELTTTSPPSTDAANLSPPATSSGAHDRRDPTVQNKYKAFAAAHCDIGIVLAPHMSGGMEDTEHGIHGYIVPGHDGKNTFKYEPETKKIKGKEVRVQQKYVFCGPAPVVSLVNNQVKFPNLTHHTKWTGEYKDKIGYGGENGTKPNPNGVAGVSFLFRLIKTSK